MLNIPMWVVLVGAIIIFIVGFLVGGEEVKSTFKEIERQQKKAEKIEERHENDILRDQWIKENPPLYQYNSKIGPWYIKAPPVFREQAYWGCEYTNNRRWEYTVLNSVSGSEIQMDESQLTGLKNYFGK